MNVLPRAIMYPGAKTKSVWQLTGFLPERFDGVIEPFAGSAAFSIHLLDKRFIRSESVWLNDVNTHLMNFYRVLVSQTDELVMSLLRLHKQHGSGNQTLFEEAGATLRSADAEPLQKAVAYFIDNCTRFGAKQNFTDSTFSDGLVSGRKGLHKPRILRLYSAAKLLTNVRLTEADYRNIFARAEQGSFFFLDPPYPSVTKDMYGPEKFDDDAFVDAVHTHRQNFLFMITLNDTDRNRASFSSFLILRKPVYYALKPRDRGSNFEIVILNYYPPNLRYWVANHQCEIIVDPASKEAGLLFYSADGIAILFVFLPTNSCLLITAAR